MSDELLATARPSAVDRQSIDAICAGNLLDHPGAIVYFKDLESRFLKVSVDCAALTGRTPAEMIGLTDFDLTDHDHAVALRADERRIIATGEPMVAKEEVDRMVDRPGTWVETSKFPLLDPAGTIIGTFGFSHEVTRYELAQQQIVRMAKAAAVAHAELIRVEGQLQAVLNGTTDAIARYDLELRYQYLNPAGERSRSSTLDQLVGRTDREFGMPEDLLQVYEPALNRVLETGEPGDSEFFVPSSPTRADTWFHVVFSPDHDATGAVVGVLTSTRDITELKRAEQALSDLAMHDSLTGLANRQLLTDRLNQALARLARYPGSLALLFIDLDHFKAVNDTYGHEVGDRVLIDTACRLEEAVRREDTVARLGGDEFIVLCDRLMTAAEVDAIAGRIVAALAEPFTDGNVPLRLSASVGAVVTDDPQAGTSVLLHRADSAMYRAKQGGRNRFEMFDPTGTGA